MAAAQAQATRRISRKVDLAESAATPANRDPSQRPVAPPDRLCDGPRALERVGQSGIRSQHRTWTV
jgi:hypothetical protein